MSNEHNDIGKHDGDIPLAQLDREALEWYVVQLRHELRIANHRGAMVWRISSTSSCYKVHHHMVCGDQHANIWLALSVDGDVEAMRVEMEDGHPFVQNPYRFVRLISSAAFKYGVPDEDLVKQLKDERPDDGVILYVIHWMRKQINLKQSSRIEHSPILDKLPIDNVQDKSFVPP